MNTVKTFLTAGLTALVLTAASAAYSAPERNPVTAAQIEAASLTKKSEMHGEMAKNFRLGGKPFMAAQGKHCAALEKDYKAAARQNLELAASHHQMAKEATR